MSARTCVVEGCERAPRSRTADYCNGHYFRIRRTGEPGPAEIKPWRYRPPCSVEGCDRPHNGHGYCLNHRRRVQKGGHPEFVTPPAIGADNPSWVGDDIGYSGAHDRVRRTRGAARAHACIDCGSPAKHWSYNHRDPNENVTPEGYAYSADPQMYDPRCVPCHKRLDLDERNSSTGGSLGAARKRAS